MGTSRTTLGGWQRDAGGRGRGRDRRIEVLHHPITDRAAALDPAAKVTNLRQQGNDQLVDVTTAKGDVLTLGVDGTTKLPSRVTSMADNANMGDVAIVDVVLRIRRR